MPKTVNLTAKQRTMRDFIAALVEAQACDPALRRARRFDSPQAFWRALGANDRVACEYSVGSTSADWMCRLLRITKGKRIFHWTTTCYWCKSGPAAILAQYPRIGMKAGKIVAYPAKGANK